MYAAWISKEAFSNPIDDTAENGRRKGREKEEDKRGIRQAVFTGINTQGLHFKALLFRAIPYLNVTLSNSVKTLR